MRFFFNDFLLKLNAAPQQQQQRPTALFFYRVKPRRCCGLFFFCVCILSSMQCAISCRKFSAYRMNVNEWMSAAPRRRKLEWQMCESQNNKTTENSYKAFLNVYCRHPHYCTCQSSLVPIQYGIWSLTLRRLHGEKKVLFTKKKNIKHSKYREKTW